MVASRVGVHHHSSPHQFCNVFDDMGHRVNEIFIGKRVMPQIDQRLTVQGTKNQTAKSEPGVGIPMYPASSAKRRLQDMITHSRHVKSATHITLEA